MLISESGYKELSDQVYNVEPSKAKSNKKEIIINNSVIIDDVTGQQYKVLSVQDNNNDSDTTNDNGMQAMAVAPIDNGEIDTSKIVIVYAGTNQDDPRDIATDVQMIGLGNTISVTWKNQNDEIVVAPSQARTALEFAQKIRKKYRNSKIITTGHSLGESLASYVALKNNLDNVGFNGPDIFNMIDDAWWISNYDLNNVFYS